MKVLLFAPRLAKLCTQGSKESFYSGRAMHEEARKTGHIGSATFTCVDVLFTSLVTCTACHLQGMSF